MQNSTEQTKSQIRPGLVVSYFGNTVAVESPEGQIFQCHLLRNQSLPVVGDKVEWQLDQNNSGRITTILPRTSVLARGDHKGHMKPIAANIDVILIVMAPPPIFAEYLVDKYLIAAEVLRIQPMIVLNKIDLLDEKHLVLALRRLAPYQAVPYPVILSSVITQDGLKGLADSLQNKTGVLVGPSGVGKSSIIAALGNKEAIRIGDVTAKGAGKHTTTATRLYHLPCGGNLIDSPGVREFNLWPIERAQVLSGFKEFQLYENNCKFRDCQHLAEPNCAVKLAVTDGKISQKRYETYQLLMKEVKSKN